LIRPSVVFLGITGTLVVALLAAFFFFRHLVVKSFPVTDGTERAAGLRAAVGVARDPYGVPHISAADRSDLAFAAGYVHAQDRLWQMDVLRRAGEGRLSELFGRKTLGMDMMFRTVGIGRIASAIGEGMSADSRAVLEAYAAGVNAFISSHRGSFPAEFDMLGYEPEPWTVRHSLIVSRLIAWELALAWWTDVTYGEIAERVGEPMAVELIPGYPDSVRPAVPQGGRHPRAERAAAFPGAALPEAAFPEAAHAYREMFGIGAPGGGSNAWAVNASRSGGGYPLLANDPHLAMPQPSRWYLMHLSSGGNDVSGVTIPGLPLVVIGHNGALAWGFTNAMIDDADFYHEKEDTSRPGHYLHAGKSLPFETRVETIRAGDGDSVEITVRSTIHGPVVNDVHPALMPDSLDPGSAGGSPGGRDPIAMRWTGMEPSDEVHGFLLMNAARGIAEFEKGLSYLTAPGQAAIYADTSGNIAFWTTGRVPVRKGRAHPMLPLPGWTGENEWSGFVDFRRLPRLINPPDGMIASANQKLADDSYSWYLSTLWEPPSRIQRIREMLQGTAQFTADDFKRMQMDAVSPYARELTGLLMRVASSAPRTDTMEAAALDYLRNWDFRFATNDVATTIFNEFYVRLLGGIYLDEMGPGLFRRFLEFGAVPNRATSKLLASDSSLWFDDAATPARESRDDVIMNAFSGALDTLSRRLGPVMKEWRWGNVHTVTFRHPFGSRPPLGRVFDVGPFEAAGGGTTVLKTEYKTSSPYEVYVGPSMRQVIDLGKPLEGFFVLTGGQSGQAFHEHYEDQTPLWLNGGYIRVTMDASEIAASPWNRLTLEPAR
jgi:penicillin amidase